MDDLGHAVELLVAERGEDDDQARAGLAREALVERVERAEHGVGVVRTVDDDARASDGERLEAGGPAHRGQAVVNGGGREFESAGAQRVGRGHGGGGVLDLEFAEQGREEELAGRFARSRGGAFEREPLARAALRAGRRLDAERGPAEDAGDVDQRHGHIVGRVADDRRGGFRALGGEDGGGGAGRDDARFFGRDLLEPVAEDVGVLVGERGDDSEVFFGEDVGAVEAAAESDLDDLDVDGVLAEGVEGERGEDLEGGDAAGAFGEVLDDGEAEF